MTRICREAKIPISWGTLAGKLWADQHPLTTKQTGVLMLHGFLDNAASFDTLIQYFPQEMTLLAIDLPGHGFSDHCTEKNSYQYLSFLSDVIEVLKYLSWDKTILVGHSLGAVLSINVAAILPHKIYKLITIDGPYPPSPQYEVLSNYMVSKYEGMKPQRKKVYSTKEKVVERIMEGRVGISRSSAEILSTRACRDENGGYVLTRDIAISIPLFVFTLRSFYELQGQHFYNQLTMPTLFILARDSEYFAVPNMEKKRIVVSPTTQLKYLRGNHYVHLNDPVEVGWHIRTFLEQKLTSKL